MRCMEVGSWSALWLDRDIARVRQGVGWNERASYGMENRLRSTGDIHCHRGRQALGPAGNDLVYKFLWATGYETAMQSEKSSLSKKYGGIETIYCDGLMSLNGNHARTFYMVELSYVFGALY